MANLKKPFYYCNECKKIAGHLDDLLFIDEYSYKGFCSEDCIEDFYLPLIRYYEILEHGLRSKHGISKEDTILDEREVEETLKHPSEVYRQVNELKESYYHFIKHYQDYTAIIVSAVYQKEASFVFMATKTKSLQMIGEFRTEEVINDWNPQSSNEDFEEEIDENLPPHSDYDYTGVPESGSEEDEDMVFMQLLESKKSKILADILVKQKNNDIPFEDYTSYDFCFQDTLDQPDEVFEQKDREGDVLFSYIRTFSQGPNLEDSFFYIIVCLKQMSSEGSEISVYPLLALPTKDVELCQEFRKGIALTTGTLKN